jgi:uncharacterized integral membrane protein
MDMGVAEPPEPPITEDDLPPALRRLRQLVTVLTATMIVGVLTIVVVLVIRLNADTRPVVIAPGDFPLPEGVGIIGLSVIDGRSVILGDDGILRVYDSESRTLLQEITLTD